MTATEYTTLRNSTAAKKAEAIVNGITRGGFVLSGKFYAHAGSRGIIVRALTDVTGLRYL